MKVTSAMDAMSIFISVAIFTVWPAITASKACFYLMACRHCYFHFSLKPSLFLIQIGAVKLFSRIISPSKPPTFQLK
jgi:hypothetical protein